MALGLKKANINLPHAPQPPGSARAGKAEGGVDMVDGCRADWLKGDPCSTWHRTTWPPSGNGGRPSLRAAFTSRCSGGGEREGLAWLGLAWLGGGAGLGMGLLE